MKRCPWVPPDDPEYIAYHDKEWGVPIHEDHKLFEFLILEGAQAGLSWKTILSRREGYRQAFDHFDIAAVAAYSDEKHAHLKNDDRIIKNRLKIQSATKNARAVLEIQKEYGSFDQYVWSFVGHVPVVHHIASLKDYPTTSPEAEALSKDMKKRGMSFVGPTIMYAFMQACGLINDHAIDCFRKN